MVEYRVTLLERAYRDIDGIYNYIADEFKDAKAAEGLAILFEETIIGLGNMPYRGAIRKNGAFANRGYRQLFVKNYTIVYRIDEKNRRVIVVTVRYTPSSF